MKKTYLSIFAIATSLASIAQSVPQCSLAINPKLGVTPDSVTNFVSGTVGVSYVQNLTVRVPKDTIASGFRVCFTRFELVNPSGATNFNLPPGLMIGSSDVATSGGTVFPGNSTHCTSIYGTPTTAGTFTLQLGVKPFGTFTAISLSCPSTPNPSNGNALPGSQTLKYYVITIAPPQTVGLQEIGKDKMGLYQNVPNPSLSTTDIKFYVEGEDNAIITIYNALGSIVSQQTVKTILGENKVTIITNELSSGTYIYSLKYKNTVATKRMMVINN